MSQRSKTSPSIGLQNIDWAAPYIDIQDEIIERLSEAFLEEGERDPSFDLLTEMADEIIEEHIQ